MAKKKHRELTPERLREVLHYDLLTGIFTWIVQRNWRTPVGSVAGRVSKAPLDKGGGYRQIGLDGMDYHAHRLAWLYMTGAWPGHKIDHHDTNRDNNAWFNLRPASHSDNGANSRLRPHNTTGFKGVSFNKNAGRYIAYVGTKYLGLFDTAEQAHKAYCAAAQEKYGAFFRAA
jgi:HNH endonuclease/AP2 domain